jgi:extracellular elastinolytic metalloproteinase
LKGDLRVSSSYQSHNGVLHSYYTQYYNNLPIVNAVTNVNTKDGEIVSFGQILYRESQSKGPDHQIILKADLDEPLTPVAAVSSFLKYLKLEHADQLTQEPKQFKDKDQVYYVDGILKESIPVTLKYLLLDDGTLSLVWDMVVDLNENWYHAHICAKTGKALQVLDWIADSAYRVFPFGTNDPNDGPRKLIVNPHNVKASPAGWHTIGSKKSKTTTFTMGNNVYAQENKEGRDNWKFNHRPDGGKSLVFDFYANLTFAPFTYLNASIVNLFYWNNIIHDLFYLYGFDEDAGNFQEFNFYRGGKQGDGVIANAQDGSGFNNANFGTPPGIRAYNKNRWAKTENENVCLGRCYTKSRWGFRVFLKSDTKVWNYHS